MGAEQRCSAPTASLLASPHASGLALILALNEPEARPRGVEREVDFSAHMEHECRERRVSAVHRGVAARHGKRGDSLGDFGNRRCGGFVAECAKVLAVLKLLLRCGPDHDSASAVSGVLASGKAGGRE